MARIDLHVHSKYSDSPSEWIFRQIGTQESYTELEDLYRTAKQAGMHLVTLTDHNTVEGSILLNQMFPQDTLTGVEVTTGFPEDGCHIHLLLYGVTAQQYRHIESIRKDIYILREYIRQENIPHSVAHATFPVNNKVTIDVLEKLILMFDVFEGINGARQQVFNTTWMKTLRSLTPQIIDRLRKKHGIDPMSADPWVKGVTGGSDDHAGVFIGRTWTESSARTPEEFLDLLRRKKTVAGGKHNDFKGMSYCFYKIAYECKKRKKEAPANRLLRIVHNIVFEGRAPGLRERIYLHKCLRSANPRERIAARLVSGLKHDFLKHPSPVMEERIDALYRRISHAIDELFAACLEKTKRQLDRGNPSELLKLLTSFLPMTYVAAPLLAALKHLHAHRDLLNDLSREFLDGAAVEEQKVLWFTDTLYDLNGVSVTLRSLADCAHEHHKPMKIVHCSEPQPGFQMSGHVMHLQPVYSYTSDMYSNYTMKMPSLLTSIDIIHQENPTGIVISTPGPVGLIGLLAAKLCGIKCTGVYHTDFKAQMEYIIGGGVVPQIFEQYTRWFYNQVDAIRVPTQDYIERLSKRGLKPERMKIFKRGLDPKLFSRDPERAEAVRTLYRIPEGFTMMFAGRVSLDKSIDLLADVYQAIVRERPDVNLIVAGDGPALEIMKGWLKDYPRVFFTGSVDRNQLAGLYSLADLFVFPSTTDTFGMVVLEAQACGLAALVSDQGGCQEIIRPGRTGRVLPAGRRDIWMSAIKDMIHMAETDPEGYQAVGMEARRMVVERYSWLAALNDIMGVNDFSETSQPDEISAGYVRPNGRPTEEEAIFIRQSLIRNE